MKILWVTNLPIAGAAEELKVRAASGTWMEPTLDDLKEKEGVRLGVACVAKTESTRVLSKDGVRYYCLPARRERIYPFQKSDCRKAWEAVIEDFRPDVLMIWGTEYTYGLCAMLSAPAVPAVIMIQGLLGSIKRYYLGGLSGRELSACYSLRNFIKRDSLCRMQKWYGKRAGYEAQMLRMAGNALIENEWAKANCLRIAPECRFFAFRQKIKRMFFDLRWEAEKCERHTVYCTAPVGYPLKGFHQVIRALAIVKEKYPDVCLRVPGMEDPFSAELRTRLKQDGYVKYLMKLITALNVRENVVFLGRLDSEEVGRELVRARVFVTASAIENQSISLREAMTVGTPSIASFAGGMPETVRDGIDGRLCRFEEYAMLAEQIMAYFEDDALAESVSAAARKHMREYMAEKSDAETLLDIYGRILENEHKVNDHESKVPSR